MRDSSLFREVGMLSRAKDTILHQAICVNNSESHCFVAFGGRLSHVGTDQLRGGLIAMLQQESSLLSVKKKEKSTRRKALTPQATII